MVQWIVRNSKEYELENGILVVFFEESGGFIRRNLEGCSSSYAGSWNSIKINCDIYQKVVNDKSISQGATKTQINRATRHKKGTDTATYHYDQNIGNDLREKLSNFE
ncbi:MAG: hypothetical protein EZS28_018066 [Streblomastix strix]|uniref:Uncharacterized protein n=1 Tax=Streblomastix strix TaxID=222440 RepID=A0A5J4VUU0_9EUKA|nr:MAG: hypothetical protein EZS28_018066 [Streblomastix strix]